MNLTYTFKKIRVNPQMNWNEMYLKYFMKISSNIWNKWWHSFRETCLPYFAQIINFLIYFWRGLCISLCSARLDLYLVIILVSVENAALHKYVVLKGSSILATFWDNNGYSEATLYQNLGNGCGLNWFFLGVNSSSLSSCHTTRTDFPNSLSSLLVFIVHHFRQIF